MLVVSVKSKNIENISLAYLHKGNYYYSISNYFLALQNYLNARESSKKNSDTYNIINFNIGLLKLELGNYAEAQQLFLEYKTYLEKNNQTNRIDYISCLYALAYNSSEMNELDYSNSYVQQGLAKIQSNNKENYSNLLLVSGINSFKKKDYLRANNTLEDVSKIIRNNTYNSENLALSEFYIGKSLFSLNNKQFLTKFNTVDSIIIKTNSVTEKLREAYPILIEYYKKQNNKEKQLHYIERLLAVDSILNKNNHTLSLEINEKYDTPNLLQEKEQLISELNSKNSLLFWICGLIALLLVILSFLYNKNRKRIKYYQHQAELLIKKPGQLVDIEKKDTETLQKKEKKNKSSISKELITNLDLKLSQFEKNKDFLQRNLTLDNLAKEFDTNRDYLSKSINELKGKSFSKYINELRIKYIVEELRINPKLQKLTIAGIAEEAGYNNSESFTNSFKRITGTLPSYYLKAIEENK